MSDNYIGPSEEAAKDPIGFLEFYYTIGRNKPIRFQDWQVKEILEPLLCTKNFEGRPVFKTDDCPCGSGRRFFSCCFTKHERWYNEALIGLPKKNGKSELAAAIAFLELFAGRDPEIYFISNSVEQTTSLAFRRLKKALEYSEELCSVYTLKAGSKKITCEGNNGIVRILPCRASTVAGMNPSLVHFDELWGFVHAESEAVFSELTLSPARTESLNLVTSYAGFRRSGPLWEMYTRGQSGKDPRMFFRWYFENKASWVKPEYLEQQKRRLPEAVYKRLHENQWTSGGGFLTERMIGDAIDETIVPDRAPGGTVGLDIGLKKDRTAMARVVSDGEGMRRLAALRVWQGAPGDEVNIAEVEKALLEQFSENRAVQCLCDPWQFAGSRQRLEKRINIREYSFTSANVQRLANVLYDAFRSRRIKIPNDPELIEELRNLQLVETEHGWKFDHTCGRHDDRAVAIALALLGEVERPFSRPLEEMMAEMRSSGERRGLRAGDSPSRGDENPAAPDELLDSIDDIGKW